MVTVFTEGLDHCWHIHVEGIDQGTVDVKNKVLHFLRHEEASFRSVNIISLIVAKKRVGSSSGQHVFGLVSLYFSSLPPLETDQLVEFRAQHDQG